jgi:hypothetical protein
VGPSSEPSPGARALPPTAGPAHAHQGTPRWVEWRGPARLADPRGTVLVRARLQPSPVTRQISPCRLSRVKAGPADAELRCTAGRRDAVTSSRRSVRGISPAIGLRAKKAAAALRISRCCASRRFSRRSRLSSSHSSVVRPSARPASTSRRGRQFRSVCSDTPSSAATCLSAVPERISSTAWRRNFGGYGGRVLGIWTSFLPRPSGPSAGVSTKPGQLHRSPARRLRLDRLGVLAAADLHPARLGGLGTGIVRVSTPCSQLACTFSESSVSPRRFWRV